jgi:hypothetical protein
LPPSGTITDIYTNGTTVCHNTTVIVTTAPIGPANILSKHVTMGTVHL